MPPLVIFLYYLCFGLLLFLAIYILARGPRFWLHRYFSLSVLCLFGWLVTLYLFDRAQNPGTILWLGRLNFTAVAFAAPFAYLFMAELTRHRVRIGRELFAESTLLGALTLFTPLIDRQEVIRAGGHVTLYGALFPLYALHVILLLGAAVYLAYAAAPTASAHLRAQLTVIGIGIAATSVVATVANIILPFGFHDFAYVDMGALSTILVLGAIAYAITVYHLFDIRIIIKKTMVLGLLLAAVHGLYSVMVYILTEWLPTGQGLGQYRFELQVLGILAVAVGLDPLKKFLEQKLDRMLPDSRHQHRHLSQRGVRTDRA